MMPRQNGSVTESSTFPSHTTANVAGTSDSVPSQRTEHATEQSDSSTFQINPTRQPQPTSSVDSGTSSQKHIQLVPSRLHHHLFGDSSASTPELSPNESAAQDEFAKLELPKLYGQNLQEHFLELGMKQTAAYREQLDIAANMQTIPRMPTKWVLQVGWTKYETVKAKNGFRTISEKVHSLKTF
ncbi:unnamed protein product [Anisakis simplex]|uniref:DNA-directed DNA polymerase n=1 Tax=Anisakis simplex TaxID=6269 RepID=A0A0M3JI30_ANISI|nr:unnamed protein product [Anisakis simplex]